MLSHIVNRKLKCYLRRNLTISFFLSGSFLKTSLLIFKNLLFDVGVEPINHAVIVGSQQ